MEGKASHEAMDAPVVFLRAVLAGKMPFLLMKGSGAGEQILPKTCLFAAGKILMIKMLVLSVVSLAMLLGMTEMSQAETAAPRVRLETNYGTIVLELNSQAAPDTVDNFLSYVREEFYDGTIFHRVMNAFMIQGGGFTADLKKKETREPIENEADNHLENLRGTVAMARTNDPHSATSQFFINSVDNAYLNHKGKTAQGWGYCVFGKVVEGMDVVDAIDKVATTTKEGMQDVPVEPVIIQKAVIEE